MERGGVNLYGFVENDGINQWDYLGLNDDEEVGPDVEIAWYEFRGRVVIFLKSLPGADEEDCPLFVEGKGFDSWPLEVPEDAKQPIKTLADAKKSQHGRDAAGSALRKAFADARTKYDPNCCEELTFKAKIALRAIFVMSRPSPQNWEEEDMNFVPPAQDN